MARVQQSPSMLACVGMLASMLLLGFAATLVVFTPSSFAGELQQEGGRFLRRLQAPLAAAPVGLPLAAAPVPVTNSSFDSSDGSSSSASIWSSVEPSKSSDSSSGSFKGSSAGAEQSVSAMLAWFGTAGGQLFLGLCFAFFYHKNAVAPLLDREGTLADKDIEFTGKDDFDNGICGCFDDKWVCIHGWCCPLMRIAHTNAVAGVCGYWETACCFFFCGMISAGLGPCCIMVYWRKQVKEVMGIEDHIINDICCTLFFPFLSLCQQATAVDRAMGYEVTGCCTLEKSRC